MIYLQLFLSFLKVGMFSFGGGYASLSLIREEVILRHSWITSQKFMDLITISQMTPGPIAVNAATFVGMQVAGPAGALMATAGCVLPGSLLVVALVFLYRKYHDMKVMNNVLGMLRPGVIALILAAGVDILSAAVLVSEKSGLSVGNIHISQIIIFAAAFVLLRKTKWNPLLIMALSGAAEVIVKIL